MRPFGGAFSHRDGKLRRAGGTARGGHGHADGFKLRTGIVNAGLFAAEQQNSRKAVTTAEPASGSCTRSHSSFSCGDAHHYLMLKLGCARIQFE